MPATLSVQDACAILADDVLGPDEVKAAFGLARVTAAPSIPFTRDQLAAARRAGEMLVLRVSQAGDDAPLTIVQMIQRFPDAFDKKLLRRVGYQLRDEWGIELEPLAATDTCTLGWALVRKEVLDESRNLAYDEQDVALRRHAAALGVAATAVRRRAAVEAVYDTLLYWGARQVRLLERTWDWSASRTVDGGYLNVGGFTTGGMQILGFSRAVRHGGLGVCPTRQPSK
jgi:hypothetical protein